MRKSIIATFACILPAILLGTVLASSTFQPNVQTQALINFHGASVHYVQGTNPTFATVLSKVQAMAPASLSKLDPLQLTDNDVTALTHAPNSLLLLDNDWLNLHASDAQTDRLLRTALSGVKLVAIGTQTSSFFDLLNAKGIHHLFSNPDGSLRNPDLMNAPEVGFALKTSTTSNGITQSYSSVLVSNSDDSNDMANAIARWSTS